MHFACSGPVTREPPPTWNIGPATRLTLLGRYERSGAADLLLDLADVAFMDSKAIGAMVAVRKAVAAAGGRMGVCSLHPHVAKIVRVVTLGAVFDVFADRAEGLSRYR